MKTILVITFITLQGLSPSNTTVVKKDFGTEERCLKKKAQAEKFYQKAQKYRTGYKEIKVSCVSPVHSKGV